MSILTNKETINTLRSEVTFLRSWLVYAVWGLGPTLSDCAPQDSTYTCYLLNCCAQKCLSQCGVFNVYWINKQYQNRLCFYDKPLEGRDYGLLTLYFLQCLRTNFKLKSNTQKDWLNLIWKRGWQHQMCGVQY